MSTGGELMHHEFKGPPTIDHWLACWDVFTTGMIMLDACTPPVLMAYGAHIAHYARRYGPQCWALIYQVETRFRREHMERARRRASMELDTAIVNNVSHEFDPARPWQFVYKKAAGDHMDSTAARYWHLHLEEPCLLIAAGAKKVDGFIDGDAAICSSSSSHMATQGSPAFSLHDVGHTGNRQPAQRAVPDRRPPAQAPHPKRARALEDTPKGSSAKVVDGKFVTNRGGHSLCHAFNAGGCPGNKKGNPACPVEPSRRHNCNRCLSSSHGASECTSTVAPSTGGPQNRGGPRNRGKGK
jgi:hypothetical protein